MSDKDRSPIKAVLFDLDDTLTDHQHCSRSGLAALQQAYPCFARADIRQFERDHEALLNELHAGVLSGGFTLEQARRERFRRLLRRYGEDPTDALATRATACYRDVYESSFQTVPGAISLLEALKPRVTMGIVTNHQAAEQRGKIKRYGLDRLIDLVVISEEVGSAKPEAEIFELALERAGCRAGEAVMVGDWWEVDVLGARGVGMRAVWLNRYDVPCPDPSMALEVNALEPTETVLDIILHGVRADC